MPSIALPDAILTLLGNDFFAPDQPIAIARAPARLDALGGIADYSGATVLEMPLAFGVYAAAQRSAAPEIVARSCGPARTTLDMPEVTIPSSVIVATTPEAASDRLHAALATHGALWAAYILGPLAIVQEEGLLPPFVGMRMAIWSDVPAGAGVSSSAALEVAALRAIQGLFALPLDPLRVATLAQRAEHRVALAPCGIMDQATATLGRRDQLLKLRCQPAEVLGYQRLPHGVQLFGVNSGVAHRVSGGQYGKVRTAAFMGRAIIAAQGRGDPPGGYLCNLSVARFEQYYAALLPERMSGAEFQARYGATGDDATTLDPETIYRVRDCAAHPIYEQANVEAFIQALERYEQSGATEALEAAGAAMYRSHASYSARCGLGSDETDMLVAMARERGPQMGVYGAKITGGGAGGTVAILAAGATAAAEIERIANMYAQRSGNHSQVLAGSGEGAWAIPIRMVTLRADGTAHESTDHQGEDHDE